MSRNITVQEPLIEFVILSFLPLELGTLIYMLHRSESIFSAIIVCPLVERRINGSGNRRPQRSAAVCGVALRMSLHLPRTIVVVLLGILVDWRSGQGGIFRPHPVRAFLPTTRVIYARFSPRRGRRNWGPPGPPNGPPSVGETKPMILDTKQKQYKKDT